MFWNFGIGGGGQGNPKTISDLLVTDGDPDSSSHNLEQILNHADILQEIKSRNIKLIHFLCLPANIIALISYVSQLHNVSLASANDSTVSISDMAERQENLRIRYPYIASEIFSSDILDLIHPIFLVDKAFAQLLSVIDLPPPMNVYQAAYWSKIMSNLLIRLTEPTLVALKHEQNFVPRLVAHVMENASMMDFLLKLVGIEELSIGRTVGSSKWLHEHHLIGLMVGYLDPTKYDPDMHGIASSALLDIVALIQAVCVHGDRMESNPLICELKSDAIISLLLNNMLNTTTPFASSSVIHSIAIFVELIRRNSTEMSQLFQHEHLNHLHQQQLLVDPASSDPMPDAAPRVPMNLCAMIRALCLHLPAIQAALLNNDFGTTDLPILNPPAPGMSRRFPLGQARLRMCELLAELLRCAIEEEIMDPEDEAYETGDRMTTGSNAVMGDHADSSSSSCMAADQDTVMDHHDSASSSPTYDQESHTAASSIASATPNDDLTRQGSSSTESEMTAVPDSTQSTLEPAPAPPHTVPVSAMSPSMSERHQALSSVYGGELQAALRTAIIETRILVTVMNLFFNYPWNNLLHGILYDISLQLFNKPSDLLSLPVAMRFLKDGQLMRWIPRAQRQSDFECEQPQGVRLGYMGHLMLIGELVHGFTERIDTSLVAELAPLIDAEDWHEFANRTLPMTKELESKPLGGKRPPGMMASNIMAAAESKRDDGDDEDDVMEVLGGIGSEQFSRYLCQQITADLPDKFGVLNDEDDDGMGAGADIDADWGGALMASSFQINISTNESPPASPTTSIPTVKDHQMHTPSPSSLTSAVLPPRMIGTSPLAVNKTIGDIDDVADMGPGWKANFDDDEPNAAEPMNTSESSD